MMRRQFKWKPVLLISTCIIVVGILVRLIFPFGPPSAKNAPTQKIPAVGQVSLEEARSLTPSVHRTTSIRGKATPTATSSIRVSLSRLPKTPTGSVPTPQTSTGPIASQPTVAVPPSPPIPPAAPPPAGQRRVTFVNEMQQTIWVAAASGHSLATSGWMLAPGASVSTTIPDHWNGRIWGRTGCSFDANGQGHCETGDCAGHFQCGKSWGKVPATLGEFNLNAYAGLDFYDISLVDGANLPMYINNYGGTTTDKINTNGCSAAGCTKNLLNSCPAVLQIKNASGQEIACTAACNVFHTDQYCCRGAYGVPSTCDPTKWPVNYARIFKAAEPFAYSYPYDDATSTLVCKPNCNYRITFGVSQ